MNFKIHHKNIGIIKPNSNHFITYTANKDIPNIKSFSTSCGCTTPDFNKDTGILKVLFKSGPLPIHLIGGEQKFNKSISVIYEDGKVDVLSFSGIKR